MCSDPLGSLFTAFGVWHSEQLVSAGFPAIGKAPVSVLGGPVENAYAREAPARTMAKAAARTWMWRMGCRLPGGREIRWGCRAGKEFTPIEHGFPQPFLPPRSAGYTAPHTHLARRSDCSSLAIISPPCASVTL